MIPSWKDIRNLTYTGAAVVVVVALSAVYVKGREAGVRAAEAEAQARIAKLAYENPARKKAVKVNKYQAPTRKERTTEVRPDGTTITRETEEIGESRESREEAEETKPVNVGILVGGVKRYPWAAGVLCPAYPQTGSDWRRWGVFVQRDLGRLVVGLEARRRDPQGSVYLGWRF